MAVINAVISDWPSGSANQGWPQEPTAMLMPGRVQGWPAGTQRASSPATTLLSQAVAWWDVEQYRDGDRFLRNRGVAGELLDLRLGSAAVANSNDPLYLAPENRGYVYLPGVSENFLRVPDAANLRITADLDVRVQVALDNWIPATATTLVSKYIFTAGNRGWYLRIDATTGTLRLIFSPDGTNDLSIGSTTIPGLAGGTTKWIRVTLDVDNGATPPQREVKFWMSDNGVSWTQLGATITGPVTQIFPSTRQVEVGTVNGGSESMSGKVYAAQIWDGIEENGGTKVLDIDCDAITSGSATSFTAVTNQTVTVNRSTSGRKSVAMPSRHKGGRPVMSLGTDDFLECVDGWQHGLLNFGQGDSFTVLTAMRFWETTATSVMAKSNTNGVEAGYIVNTGSVAVFAVKDGVNLVQATRTMPATGTLTTVAGVKNSTARTLTSFTNGVAGTPVQDTSASNTSPLAFRIGRYAGSGSLYGNFELYGAAIFRRALSPAEIKTISDYMTARIA